MEGGDGKEKKREKVGVSDSKSEKRENVGLSEEALKKCLEERKGDNSAMITCKSILEAFNKTSSSASSAPSSSSPVNKKRLPQLRLRSGSITDV